MYSVSFTVEGWPALPVRRLNRMHARTWLSDARFWRRRFSLRHFQKTWGRRYGYRRRAGEAGGGGKPRRGSYSGRKLAKFKHQKPLVWIGLTRRETRSMDRNKARKSGVRIGMPAGLRRRPKGGRINMFDEATRVLASEKRAIGQNHMRVLNNQLGRANARRSVVAR